MKKKELMLIAISALLILVYAATRYVLVRTFPWFIDELIYGRWAQLGFYHPSERLYSLLDGKQPLYIWLVSLCMKLIINPVTAGRLVSLAAGFLTCVGLYFVGYELFKKKTVGILAAGLYVIFPLALIHDSLALYDSLVGTFYIWSMYLGIILVRKLDKSTAFILALIWGGGLLTKSSGIINIYMAPFMALVGNFRKKKSLINWILYLLVAGGLAFIYQSVIYLSDASGNIANKNQLFIRPLGDVLGHGIIPIVWPNLIKLSRLTFFYLTPTMLIFITGVFFILRKFRRELLLCLLFFLIPFGGLVFFGKIVASRYLLFMIIPLFPVAAAGFVMGNYRGIGKRILYFLGGVSVVYMIFFDFMIITNLNRAPFPEEDMFQYVIGWPSGYGMKQIINYLLPISYKQKIIIANEGEYGSLPMTATEIYFFQNPNVEIRPALKPEGKIPDDLLKSAGADPVFLITNKLQDKPGWPVKLELAERKGDSGNYLRLYRVIPEDN